MNPQPPYPGPNGSPGYQSPGTRQLVASPPPTGVFSGPPYNVRLPRSYKGLIRVILAVILVVTLTGGGVWAYFQYVAPAARAKSTAEKYITALNTDDIDLAAYLSSSEIDFALLESASQSIQGEHTLVAQAEHNGTYYFLYDLTNASTRAARTTVVKTDKGYRVDSFVFSDGRLAVMPDDPTQKPMGGIAAVAGMTDEEWAARGGTSGTAVASTGSNGSSSGSSSTVGSGSSSGSTSAGSSTGAGSSSSSGSSSGSSGTVSSTVCLAQRDYYAIFDDAQTDDGTVWNAANPYRVDIGYNPGSTTYIDSSEVGDLYALWLKFYKTYPKANYTIHVTGSTYDGNTGLASQRASRSSGSLQTVGVPAAKIVVDGVVTTDAVDDPDSDGVVTLSIVPGC